jgi:poly(A) polymerase Pap1
MSSWQEAKALVVERVGELLTEAHMDDIKVIPRARVPVCKASLKGISFDVTVSGTF